tara:strand:- start:304 stop:612 length:309 start_codon:yes stop_codon:yes gene_type:complete
MEKFREIKTGDTLVFRGRDGDGSFVKVPSKGFYFSPSKENMQLKGESFPIAHLEKFTYKEYKILDGRNPRVVKLFIVRNATGHMCQISENDLFRNFSVLLSR